MTHRDWIIITIITTVINNQNCVSLFLLLSFLNRAIARYSLTTADTIECPYKASGAAADSQIILFKAILAFAGRKSKWMLPLLLLRCCPSLFPKYYMTADMIECFHKAFGAGVDNQSNFHWKPRKWMVLFSYAFCSCPFPLPSPYFDILAFWPN